MTMKITKRQLRNLIKEAMPRGGVPDVVGTATGVYGEKNRRQKDPRLAAMDYKEWARDYMGTSSGANSSSVLATYAVEKGLPENDWMPIALAMDFTPRDVGLEIARQQKEYDAGGPLSDEETYQRSFKEGLIRITRRQLKRIIREQMEEDLWVVIGNAGHGQQNMWPKSDEPEAYAEAEAEKIAKDLNSKMGGGYMQIHYHTKPLSQAIKYVSSGNEAHIGLLDLMDQHGLR